jgi:cation diffusion facilitator CzcD-associated flavoprotein CzcO
MTQASLAAHERSIARDLELLNLPARQWTAPLTGPDGAPLLDVLVVGAGMCGIAASAALRLKGIGRTLLLDRNPDGREGPWVTYARMDTLRSPKHLTGPALGLPGLTFRAWYEASQGRAAWDVLGKIPNPVWMDYLTWLRRVLALPIEHETEVTRIEPAQGVLAVSLRRQGKASTRFARRVVLATGRDGAGGLNIPEFVGRDLWPDRAAHTVEAIDFAALAGKRIAVLGAGASAWDNAATALEAGAAAVDMYVRRRVLPQVNKSRGWVHPGYFIGYGGLSDAERWAILHYLHDRPAPPPRETVLRTLRQPGFAIHLGRTVTRAWRSEHGVALRLAEEDASRAADFLILGTGFRVDLSGCRELGDLVPLIAAWGDRYEPPPALRLPALARLPYLGSGFELQERRPGTCPEIGRIHLFNHGATASLGAVAGDIPGIDFGAERLAAAITAAFFREDLGHVRAELEAFAEPELEGTPFFAL